MFFSELPTITSTPHVLTQNSIATLTWHLPTGTYTNVRVKRCLTENDCQHFEVPVNGTHLELDTGEEIATYRLEVYQHGQLVVSKLFDEIHPTVESGKIPTN